MILNNLLALNKETIKEKPAEKPSLSKSIQESKKNLKDKSNPVGSFDCDIPEKIISAKLESNKEMSFELVWKFRYDKTKPGNTFFSIKTLKEKCPLLLIDFFETKLTGIQ